jgi:starvation-inducible DNA-binding protein
MANQMVSNTTGKTKKGSKRMMGTSPAVRMQTRAQIGNRAAPHIGQRSPEIQPYGTRTALPIALPNKACEASIKALNQTLADTFVIRDLYKKHHWQVSGRTFFQLHLLFDKHYEEQSLLIDKIAERIQMLGGISITMAHDIAEMTKIERPPRGREEVPVQISRLLDAHQTILADARRGAKEADKNEDDGTNDLFVSDIIRTNEMQVWFISQHLVDLPLVDADNGVQ